MKLCSVALILGCFLPAYCFAQQAENEIVINVKEHATAPTAASVAEYLNGYRSSINGQTIEYHSSDPDADSALLVRGQTVAPSISWETDPLPQASSDYLQFIWLAGIECAGFAEEKDSHTFD